MARQASTRVLTQISSRNYLLALLLSIQHAWPRKAWHAIEWIRAFMHVFALLQLLAQEVRSSHYDSTNFATLIRNLCLDGITLPMSKREMGARAPSTSVRVYFTLCHGARLFVSICRLILETVRTKKTKGWR
mmetsp:Transcript_10067/g.11771  ORF Transcript_10067/g.11771 Transcript_10067/m.11771 type:complete len:132 (+) Transcript_10067:567-962(+)